MNIYSVEEIQAAQNRFNDYAEAVQKLNGENDASSGSRWGRIALGTDGRPEVHIAKSARGKVWHFLKETVLRPYMYYQNYKLLKNLESSVRECFTEDHKETVAKEIREIASAAAGASKSSKPYMGSYQSFAEYVAKFANEGGRKFQEMEEEGSSVTELNVPRMKRSFTSTMELSDLLKRGDRTSTTGGSVSSTRRWPSPVDENGYLTSELGRPDGNGEPGSKEQSLLGSLTLFGRNQTGRKSYDDILSERDRYLPSTVKSSGSEPPMRSRSNLERSALPLEPDEESVLPDARAESPDRKPVTRSKSALGRRKSFVVPEHQRQSSQSKSRPTSRAEMRSFSERPGSVGFGHSPVKRYSQRTPDARNSVFSIDSDMPGDDLERSGQDENVFSSPLRRATSANHIRPHSTLMPTPPRRGKGTDPVLRRSSSTSHIKPNSTLTPTSASTSFPWNGASSHGDLTHTLKSDGKTMFLHAGPSVDGLLGEGAFQEKALTCHTERVGRIRAKIHAYMNPSPRKLRGRTLGGLSRRLNLGVGDVVLRSVSLLAIDAVRLGFDNYCGFISFLQPGYGRERKSKNVEGSQPLVSVNVRSSAYQCEQNAFFRAAWEAMLEYEISHNPVEGEEIKATSDAKIAASPRSKLSTAKSGGAKIITNEEDLVDPFKIIYEEYVTNSEEVLVQQDVQEATLTHL